MKSSQQWWDEVKASPELLINWLKRQYHGERTAHDRMQRVLQLIGPEGLTYSQRRGLVNISHQELQHAEWIGELLLARGVHPTIMSEEDSRYWAEAISDEAVLSDQDKVFAIGAHAELMRLERIKVIAFDGDAPADIREVFSKILPEEVMHESFFRHHCSEEAYLAAAEGHEKGALALGLVL